jgi:uncharacterized protein YjiS (DUF1127 family)
MELFMKKVYLATVIAMVVTTSIASHVLAVGALGPAAPGFLVGLRSRASGVFSRLRRFVGNCIAVIRAERERRAAITALRALNDRELKDIGLYRSSIGPALFECEWRTRISDRASAFHAASGQWR